MLLRYRIAKQNEAALTFLLLLAVGLLLLPLLDVLLAAQRVRRDLLLEVGRDAHRRRVVDAQLLVLLQPQVARLLAVEDDGHAPTTRSRC